MLEKTKGATKRHMQHWAQYTEQQMQRNLNEWQHGPPPKSNNKKV